MNPDPGENLFGVGASVAHRAGEAGLTVAKVAGDVCCGRETIFQVVLPALPVIGIEEYGLPTVAS